jgi:hypothetical protein
MSKDFKSFGALASHLAAIQLGEAIALHKGLELAAKRIEATAKNKIGEYQDGVGPFVAWADLADSTEKEKERLGYPLDAPLLRNGDLRESIGHEVGPLEAIVGSTEDVMVYQEMGTEHIPPRPVLGPAAIENEEEIVTLVGAASVAGLLGGSEISSVLGYNFKTAE